MELRCSLRGHGRNGQTGHDKVEDSSPWLPLDTTGYSLEVKFFVFLSPTSPLARLLELTLEQYRKGNFKPITPVTIFDAIHIEDAFRLMQKGSHMGKIVIKFPEEDTLPLTSTVPVPNFRGDVSYLLVGGLGGLGGLGLAIASFVVAGLHAVRQQRFCKVIRLFSFPP